MGGVRWPLRPLALRSGVGPLGFGTSGPLAPRVLEPCPAHPAPPRRAGKELAMAARQEEELRLKRILEQRQREKEEEARAREKIRARLEEDRRERRRRLGLPEELTEEEKEEERRKLQVWCGVLGSRAARLPAGGWLWGGMGDGKVVTRVAGGWHANTSPVPLLQAKLDEEKRRKLPIKPVEGEHSGEPPDDLHACAPSAGHAGTSAAVHGPAKAAPPCSGRKDAKHSSGHEEGAPWAGGCVEDLLADAAQAVRQRARSSKWVPGRGGGKGQGLKQPSLTQHPGCCCRRGQVSPCAAHKPRHPAARGRIWWRRRLFAPCRVPGRRPGALHATRGG